MFKRLLIIFVMVAAAFAWACNNGGSTETHYIKLSDSALTFNGAGNASRTVTVASSPADWKAEPAVSWIKITAVSYTHLHHEASLSALHSAGLVLTSTTSGWFPAARNEYSA